MTKRLLFLFLLFISCLSCKEKKTYVKLDTTKGIILLHLYDETLQHKNNFLRLVEEGFFDDVLFHRVIDEFMIQTGDPNSRSGAEGQIGAGGPGYRLNAEIQDSLFHKKGALAAARDNNPEKQSSGSQFYIVEGKTYTKQELKELAASRDISFSEEEINTYTTIGGTPFLDENYTVFGEVVQGMNVVDSISNVQTNEFDRPLEDIRIIRAEIVKLSME